MSIRVDVEAADLTMLLRLVAESLMYDDHDDVDRAALRRIGQAVDVSLRAGPPSSSLDTGAQRNMYKESGVAEGIAKPRGEK